MKPGLIAYRSSFGLSLRNSQGHSAPALAPASHHTAGSLGSDECAYSSCSSSLHSVIGQSIAGRDADVNSVERRNMAVATSAPPPPLRRHPAPVATGAGLGVR